MMFEPPYELSLAQVLWKNKKNQTIIKMKTSITNMSSTPFTQLRNTQSKPAGVPDSIFPLKEGIKSESHLGPISKEYLFKVLVIGELGTGKTSFIKRYVHHFFSSHYRATIGVDFALKVMNWPNSIVRIQLWDIAGQERFGHMTRVYYKEAAGAFIVFDVSRPQTFEAVLKWKSDLDSKVCLPDGSPIPCLLLANKCDESKAGSLGEETFLDQFCRDNKFIGWYYTSPKENINVEESANFLVRKIIQNKRNEDAESIEDSKNVNQVLSLTAPKDQKDGKCC